MKLTPSSQIGQSLTAFFTNLMHTLRGSTAHIVYLPIALFVVALFIFAGALGNKRRAMRVVSYLLAISLLIVSVSMIKL